MMDEEEIETFKEDWASLTPPGRNHYRKMYRQLRHGGHYPMISSEDRETAREHVAMVLHVDRNKAWSMTQAELKRRDNEA